MPIRETAGDIDADNDDAQQNQTEHEDVELEAGAQARAEPEIEVVEDDGQQDERIAQSDDDQDHGRRRETAAERRARAKQAKERDKRELDFQRREMKRLESQIHDLTQGQVVTRVTELDNRLASAQAEIAQWERVKAAAISKHEGADAVAADNFLKAAQDKAERASWDKQQLMQTAQQPARQEVPFSGLMQEFLDANEWYNPNGVDEDSLLVKAIDTAVAQKYRPTDPAYWRDLQKRVDARIGKNERQQSRNDDSDEDDVDEPVVQTRKRSGPPVGGSNRSNSSGGAGAQQIRLSPERVQAMKDAGLWEDPKVRAKMAKTYSEYDRNNPNR